MDTLTFLTGDQLSGKFLGIDRDEGIRFHHPDAESPILFALKNLHELTFAHAPIPEISESLIMAQLTNGDRISGNVIRMDGEHLILKTRYAGEVNILRSALTRLLPASSGHLLYAGPGEKSDWVFQNTGHANTWVFRDGVMRSDGAQGGVGRKLPALPEQFKIDMDLAWRGMPYIQISLMSQDARNPHSGSWTLMIHGENFRMYRQGGIGHLDMGNVQVAGFNAKQKSKLSIRVDKPEKRITLLVDDVQAHQWQDPNGFQAGGENLIFQAQQSMPYAISNLTVSVWDGKNTPASASAETSDILELVNGDRISGKLLRIDGQTLKFQNDFTAFDLPLNRVASVNFDKSRQTSARLQQSDVEARIFGGDRLTLALASLSPEQLAGDSENLGHVRVKSPHLERLHFNLYDPRKKTLGEDSDF
ncbi:MAG: hypothetical protein LAT83_05225 [Kiritimatiellae bacterium]|nr:hypothetical protein [Kiritimatiellia bacterium]